MAKTSKWFVVATEGATTDGRTINRAWIEQMAANYDLKKYGARVNIEHIKFRYFWSDEAHSKCYGDVTALKAEENAEGKLQLLAQIDPTDELIALNKNRQKIYTSIECDPNFADTGEAYLVGLAVTDSPASLGTDILAFSAGAKVNPFADRKEKPENLFTASIETTLEFDEIEDEKPSLFVRIKEMFNKKERSNEERFADVDNAVLLLSDHLKEITENLTSLQTAHTALQEQFTEITKENAVITEKLSTIENQPSQNFTPRPKTTGGELENIETDC